MTNRINDLPPGDAPRAFTYAGWAVRVLSGKFLINGEPRDGHVDTQRGELVIRDPGTPEGLAINAMRVWNAVLDSGARPEVGINRRRETP